jgi:toxin ParE1/3/4
MAGGFRFSRRAERDLRDIGDYTFRTWGESQTAHYLDQMEACCKRVAGEPGLGRACDHIRVGLRRVECGRHVVFYRQSGGGILIVRILHERMLPERQLGREEAT